MNATRNARDAVWIVAVMLCAACNNSAGPGADIPAYVSLVTQGTSFQGDEAVLVEVTNHTPYFIRGHFCQDTVVDRLTENGWRPVRGNGPCTDDVQLISPNSVRVGGVVIPPDARPGTYRIRFERMVVMPDGASEFSVPAEQRVTNTFAVR